MEILAASMTCWAFSSSRSIAVNSSLMSSTTFSLCPMWFTTLAKVRLSVTILLSSGKCHENHSLSLMQKVLMFLSMVSISAMVWIMGLSYLLTSVAHCCLEYWWARPNCAFLESSSLTFLRILGKWVLIPLINSSIESLYEAVKPLSEWILHTVILKINLRLTHFRISNSEQEFLFLCALGSWEIGDEEVLESLWHFILSNGWQIFKSFFCSLEWLESCQFNHLRETL